MKITTMLGFVAGASLLGSLAGACSDDPTSSTGGNTNQDGGTSTPGTTPGTPGSPPPPGPSPLNGCITFSDRTGASADRTLPWDEDVANNPSRCMTIKVGQTVTFTNPETDGGVPDFETHPAKPHGGDTPNPFGSIPANGVVTFPTAGKFGFQCDVHASMTGVITVQN